MPFVIYDWRHKMKGKSRKKGIKLLLSVVIATIFVLPTANVFLNTGASYSKGNNSHQMYKININDYKKSIEEGYAKPDTGEGGISLPPSVSGLSSLHEEFNDWIQGYNATTGGYECHPKDWIQWDWSDDGVYIYLWDINVGWDAFWNKSASGMGSTLAGADSTYCAWHPGFSTKYWMIETEDVLISPAITIGCGMSIQFDYLVQPNPYAPAEPLVVYIVHDEDPTDYHTSLNVIFDWWGLDDPNADFMGQYGNTGGAWARATIPWSQLMPYLGKDIYLVFLVDTTNAGEIHAVDNVRVQQITPEHDVDVTALVKPDPSQRHNTAPTEIWAKVKNVGKHDEYNIDLHLQIYKEITYQPEIDWYDNMESCCVNWTAYDGNGDGLTWTRTERRSLSPTHSWRSTACDRATYAGNSDDWLISKPITIPDWETKAWLNFSMWVQGEISQSPENKFEDYLEVGIYVWNTTTSTWDYHIIDKYVDTGGEWMHPENMADGTQRLNIFGADYDHWNCSKGSGAPYKWWGGIDLDPYLNYSVAGKTIEIAFRWVSDPCNNFEGAYIDDVRILSLRGPKQPLVYQGYKFLHELDVNQTKLVSFPLEYKFDDNTVYFIEVYSNLENDTDGYGDSQGVWATKIVPGMEDPVRYWLPCNGVNESVYFGDIHDAAVTHVSVPDEVELTKGQCEENVSAAVPIKVTVYNNGTLEEDIPVKVLAREKIVENIFWDDMEDLNASVNKWEGVYFVGDSAPAFYWDFSDMDPHSGKYHLLCGDSRGFLHGHMIQGIFTVLNPDNTGYVMTGNELNVMFRYWAQWKMDAEGHSNFELGTPIWYVDYDAWAPIMEDPVHNAGLGTFPSRDLGYLVTGHSNDEYYGPSSPGPYINPNDVPPPGTNARGVSGSKYSRSLFEIDVKPWMEHYAAIGYDHFNFGWVVHTDESGMPDFSYPGDLWSGLKIDDVSVDVEVPGPVVWESQVKTVHLKPGESKVVEFTWNATQYCNYIIEGRTLLEGDCDHSNDYAINETYLYTQAYYDDIEHIGNPIEQTMCKTTYKNWETEDNTCKTPSPYASICDNGACDWNLNHYWYLGNASTSQYPANADIVLQMVNVTEDGELGGPNHDGAFNLTAYDDFVIDFTFWMELENNSDWLTLEISNDSGKNWFIPLIAGYYTFACVASNAMDTSYNAEPWWIPVYYTSPTAWKRGWQLWNYSAGYPLMVADGYDPATGPINPHVMDVTNEMHFRFHLLADGSAEYKGVYIDDVYLNTSKNVTIPWNGVDHNWTWETTTIFHDDMENPEESAMKWITFDGAPIGDMWHVTTHCYAPMPGGGVGHSWWIGDEYPWSNYNKHLQRSVDGVNTSIHYDSSYMNYRMNMEDNLTLNIDLSDKFQAYLIYDENYTFADSGDYGILWVSNDGGATWHSIGGAAGTSGGWITKKADLTPFLPAVLKIRWEFISDGPHLPGGWSVKDSGDAAGDTWGISPTDYGHNDAYCAAVFADGSGTFQDEWLLTPTISLPSDVDSLTFYHRADNAANDNALNYLRISTDGGNTWTVLWNFSNTYGTLPSSWTLNVTNLTAYAGEDVIIAWQYRSTAGEDWFIDDIRINDTSNNTIFFEDFAQTAEGWQIDNINITAKADCLAPTTTAILNPPTPDGCNGWYKSPVEITLVATDNREVDSTYYSIDGGAWLKYTGPITVNVDGEHTVSYYSVDTVGNKEKAKSVSFKIDTTAPSASITYPNEGYIYIMGKELFKNPFGGTFIIGKMTFQADASDATSGVNHVHFAINGFESDDTTSPYQYFWHNFDFLPHKYTLTVTAEDNACNVSPPDTLSFTHWL